MSLSWHFRRAVVLAMDEEAESAMHGPTLPANVNLQVLALSDEVFGELIAVFHAIGKACGIPIDDYEEDTVPADRLGVAAAVVRSTPSWGKSKEAQAAMRDLERILLVAISIKRPVHFVL